jgi:hypothetical protein
LAAQGVIGSVAAYHYSFMGASDPSEMEPTVHGLAQLLAADEEVVEGWACPINFTAQPREQSGGQSFREAFRREVAELRPWYDLSVQKHDRTAGGDFAPVAHSIAGSGKRLRRVLF